eukprot:scaffold56138_cov18-Tisochrysis_lutea.AAC.1
MDLGCTCTAYVITLSLQFKSNSSSLLTTFFLIKPSLGWCLLLCRGQLPAFSASSNQQAEQPYQQP